VRHVLDYCRARQDWLLDTTTALARIESPTTDKAAVDACGRELARRLEALGGRVTRLPRDAAGDHLLAEAREVAAAGSTALYAITVTEQRSSQLVASFQAQAYRKTG